MGRIEKLKRQLINEANIRILKEENTDDKIAVLFDGTSSAGKSKSAELLNAPKFFEATDPNNWVVIDSDHFSNDSKAQGGEGEKRRLKHDHPNIRDWSKDFDNGIVSGLYRKGDPEGCIKELENEAKKKGKEVNPIDVEKCKNIPENPYEDQYIEGTDPRLWYMSQEYKKGKWKKVIFDDIGNDIIKYLPEIKHKLLIHAPIYILMRNIGGRNKDKNIKNHRDPKEVLKQYLEKYEATTSEPDESVGDPTTEMTRNSLKNLLMDKIVDTYPDYNEEYIDGFIKDLGVTTDNTKYWIKVKDGYLLDDQLLINVGTDQQTYINTIGDKLGIEKSEEDIDS